MSGGCLGALFGIGWKPDQSVRQDNREDSIADLGESDMSEGDIHSGPGGYEGMGYSGGYAADYFGCDEGEEH